MDKSHPLNQLAAIEAALARLTSAEHTVPIRLRPNADAPTVHRTFMSHLRSQMYLQGL